MDNSLTKVQPFTLTVKMSLQMFYSNIMAHMPSAYGLGKNIIFNKVQFSSVQFSSDKHGVYQTSLIYRPRIDEWPLFQVPLRCLVNRCV